MALICNPCPERALFPYYTYDNKGEELYSSRTSATVLRDLSNRTSRTSVTVLREPQ